MQRTIDAPEQEWLTDEESAKFLGIPAGTFGYLVRHGKFPKGKRWTSKEVRWPWRLVLGASWLMESGYFDSDIEDAEDQPEESDKRQKK